MSGGNHRSDSSQPDSKISQDGDARPKRKAVLLRVDSPGVGLAASTASISNLNASRTRGEETVVSMGGVAASAYYISGPADEIVANPPPSPGASA